MRKVVLFVSLAILIAGNASSQAEIFFSDNFDSGQFNPGWTGRSPSVVMASDNPLGGAGFSARAVYNYIEDTNCLTINPSRDDYYLRYYIYYALGMEYWRCKISRLGYWDEQKSYYVNVGWGCDDGINESGMTYSIRGTSGIDKTLFFDWTHPKNSCSGKWLCLEFHIKMNTPGQSDGMLEAWIDGVQVFSQGSLNIRGNIAENPYYHWVFGNYSNGVTGTPIPGAPWYVWIDDVVYSTERIYPLKPGPEETNTPMPPPTETPAAPPTQTPLPQATSTPAPSPSGDEIIWSDGFESGNTSAWTEAVETTIVSDPEKVYSGNYAVEFKYEIDDPYNGWLWRKHLNPEKNNPIYVRWYQKWQTGWVWSPGDFDQKIMLLYGLDPPDEWGATADWRIYLHQFNGVGVPQLLNFRTPDGWTVMKQNFGAPYEFGTNKWECIEIMIKTNTVGKSDGAIAMWLGGQMHAFYANVQVRTTDTAFNALMVNCWYTKGPTQVQYTWVDDVVVSTSRIGTGNPVRAESVTLQQ